MLQKYKVFFGYIENGLYIYFLFILKWLLVVKMFVFFFQNVFDKGFFNLLKVKRVVMLMWFVKGFGLYMKVIKSVENLFVL